MVHDSEGKENEDQMIFWKSKLQEYNFLLVSGAQIGIGDSTLKTSHPCCKGDVTLHNNSFSLLKQKLFSLKFLFY